MHIPGKNLTQQSPTSPRVRVGGYAILARMADKGRATLNGNVGEYHFNCPLDNYLFGFKEVKGEDVKNLLASGTTNDEISAWLDSHGAPKTAQEVKAWSDAVEAANPYENPEKREWFKGECEKVGLNPETSTLFDFLEKDDSVSFKS
jgi:hypothetical protein